MTKLRYRFFLIFTILNIYGPMIFHSNFQPKISSSSGEEVDFVIIAILETLAILDIQPDPIYNSETLESGHAPWEICEL